MNQHQSNGFSLTARHAAWAFALGLWACSNTLTGPGGSGGGDDPSSGSAGIGTSGSNGVGGSSAGTSAGGIAGTSGTGVGGVGGTANPTGYDMKLDDGKTINSHYVRLTHQQWENSVRDLLKLPAVPGLASMFASDTSDGMFSNNELRLFVTSTLWSDYQRAAEDLAKRVAMDAQARTAIGATGDPATFITTFGRRAYRRPLEPLEQQRYEALFASAATLYTGGDAFANGVELVIRAMLQSPHFVYRTELGTNEAPLSGYEAASKLSFLLRDTMPDDALFDAAERGELSTIDGVLTQARAMIDAPAAQSVVARYHNELFGLFRYEGIEKDRTAFPNYQPTMNQAFMDADRMFFDAIFRDGQGLREILLSTKAFVNSAIAPLYDVTASGSGMTEVTLGPDRPGFFTRASFLAYNANLSDPDPIHRGVDMMHRLLCINMVPPPGEIPPLPAAMPGQTNRERVTAHTGSGECAGCHAVSINPLGFALENFDALGQTRTMDAGKLVNTADSYDLASTGIVSFAGAPELMAILAESPDAHACYSRRLGEYALGRDMNETDRQLLNDMLATSTGTAGSIKNMLLAAIRSPRFSTRTGGAL
jgi:hypothetical protein